MHSRFTPCVLCTQDLRLSIQGDSMEPLPPDFYSCYKIIIQVNACRECKVNRLTYNSSANVVFDGIHDVIDGDESLPYPGRCWDIVTDLRTHVEALILCASDNGGLLTCALRPCNVFGSGDKELLPLLVHVSKSNWAKLIIGNGNNLSDFTCVDNVAHAHICAEESLSSLAVSGKEALKLTIHSFSDLAIDFPFARYKDTDVPSKVEQLLRCGNGFSYLGALSSLLYCLLFRIIALSFQHLISSREIGACIRPLGS